MSRKQEILSLLRRDELRALVNALDLTDIDRRSPDAMRQALLSHDAATIPVLLEPLSEADIKEICEQLSLSPTGRKRALIDRLAVSDPPSPASSPAPTPAATTTPAPTSKAAKSALAPVAPEPAATSAQRLPITRTELVWPGKYDAQGRRVEPPRLSLPFQVVEVIEEGRALRGVAKQKSLLSFFNAPPQNAPSNWRNKLIWGDNLLVQSALLQDFAGKIDLIYIDPPFLAGRDFKHSTIVGEGETLVEESKTRSIIQTKAYYDTWGQGRDSYLASMWRRLLIARDLLSDNGSIYFHIGPGMNHCIRLILDELFGADRGIEIIWKRTTAHSDSKLYGAIHDSILFYTKSDNYIWHDQYTPHDKKYLDDKYGYQDANGRRYMLDNITSPNPRPNMMYNWKGHESPAMGWRYSLETMTELDAQGRIWYPDSKTKRPRLKRYLDESLGVPVGSVWTDINPVNSQAKEDTGYDTQKPETLLERIIKASSNPDSLVADFFSGSGTTVAVAEKLGRRWIGCDLGRFAVHTARKRLLDVEVMDEGTGEKRGCRPFEILNLGKYERKHWQGITFGNEPREDEAQALAEYVTFVLRLYAARPFEGVNVHGRKAGALVHVGAIDAPVTIAQIEEAAAETKRLGVKLLDVLGWEFEMGLYDPVAQYVKAQHGVTVRLKSIPREVMEAQAVDKGDIQFFDLAFLELSVVAQGKGATKNRAIKVVLNNFVIPSTDLIPQEVRDKVKKWSDYIDYWAVDWDFRNDTFMNQWQTYRTRQDRALPLESAQHVYEKPGTYQVLVKVVDIFGNDTSHLVKWEA